MENETSENGSTTVERILTTSREPVAKIVTSIESGVKAAYDRLGTLKARYNPRTDITYDPQGRAVCRGNNLIAMALDFVDRTAANSPPRG
jgi:hypothetical protein